MEERPIKVLLVEDNPGDARLLREILAEVTSAQFELVHVERLSEALKHLAEEGIDVTLLDLSLPDGRGLDTITQAHAQAPDVPIVVLTGLDDEALAVRAVREGAQDYLVKGQIDSNLLVRAIRYAIERKRAEKEIKRRGEELEALREISLAVTAQLELDEVLQNVVEWGCCLLDVGAGGVYLVDEQRGDLELVVSRGYTRDYTGTRLAPGEGLAGRVLQSGAPLAVADYRHWEGRSPDWEAEPLTAALGVPLKRGGQVIGVLSFAEMAQARSFDEHDVWLSTLFANQATIAIENARLYQAEQRGREVAEVLQETARVVNASLNLDEVLPLILEQLAQVIEYDSSTVLLLGDGRFKVTACRGFPDMEGALRLSFSADEDSLSLAVVRARRPLIIEDVQSDPRWQPVPATAHIHGWIGAPLIVRDRVTGVLGVDSCRPGAYSEEDGHLVSTFANQAAVAIENARLFTETSQRVRELRLLHDVGLAAASGVGLEKTLQAAAVALAVELQGNNVALMLLDAEGGTLRMEASVGYPPGVIEDLRLRLGEGITGWVAQHGEPALVPDVRLDPRYYEGDSNTRSELCVPLTADSRVIGVINVESAQPGVFTDDDQRLLSTLASNLVVLIERARLFEEVEAARMESQQRAEALEEANVRLRELDRLKSEFLANMSHELRTPLNSVIGFSEVLIDGLVGEVSSEQEECLGNIRSSGKHLLALINDILDLSKIEAGRVELKMATFDVAGLLAEVQVTIRPLIEKKSQVLKIERAEGLPLLTADRFRIKQVLLNLLSNAHKFTLVEGHITLSCRLVDQATMLFSVTDTGIGIKPEDQRVIFEEFRQADGSASREITGTGLGLAISKRLVEMHGGRIWVESEYGHGATFSVLLPLDGSWAPEAGAAEETALVSEGKTVLVVEDDRQFSDLLAFYLRQEGYIPVRHYNGVGVLDKARELKPALITLDIMLPDQDGWEVLRALKSDPQTRDVPVMVVSALEDGELAFSLGAVDYLVKPIGRDDLHRLLNRLAAPDPLTRHITILAVDDDPGVIKLLQQMLPADSCTLLAAYDGEQGLSLARSEHPDVILLDLLMLGMSGFEVLEALRADAETAGIPVFVLTAKEVTEGERELLNDHIQGLMRKSALTPQSLLAELRRLETLALQPEVWTRARTPQAGPEACR